MVKYFSSDSFFLEKSVLSSLISKKELSFSISTSINARPKIAPWFRSNCAMD